ncbi:MAG: CBASS cGAMP-activated phospholipase [Cyanobacteria bacterium MAG CAR1_bin_15]|nr:CBASS cGAMP-activated phospholipase [Cyanobacteria bacterium MAG CAR1_bin_15]
MQPDAAYDHTVPRRSDGTRQSLRPVQPWPEGKPFKILSIDGGGILGLLPCMILAELENRFLDGQPIGRCFDMIVGTSTGGIIALGLGQDKSAKQVSSLYIERGKHIFPGNQFSRLLRNVLQVVISSYSRRNLENELRREFRDVLFGSATVPTCIPSFDGRYGEPYIFKTPHHPDYKKDQNERLVNVGLSTAAAPTFFSAVERDGYVFVDGGIWANNPAMIGVVDALTCFDIDRTQIRLLSLGCGQEIYRMRWWHRIGGLCTWAQQFYRSAMRAQSHNALGQAGLLIGRSNLIRLDAPEVSKHVAMDDVDRAIVEMPPVARSLVEGAGQHIADLFLTDFVREDGTS